jgi:hypothetical protein
MYAIGKSAQQSTSVLAYVKKKIQALSEHVMKKIVQFIRKRI